MAVNLIHALICVSEKAAEIARAIRREDQLLELLVQVKGENEKNKRFETDFKTLADVLIQEAVRHDIRSKFPKLESIYGEESNTFTNQLGEKITVKVEDSIEETAKLLSTVLCDNMVAATLLAKIVHSEVQVPKDKDLENLLNTPMDFGNLGIWVDPIDGTAEYVQGNIESDNSSQESGLQCVTVLIGVYDKKTGIPIIGVVNQPFHEYSADTQSWTGQNFWGLCHNGARAYSTSLKSIVRDQEKNLVLSTTEDQTVKELLQSHGYKLSYASGAGYKQLSVILGKSSMYLMTKASTYFWDTCGPHALLRALGGGILEFKGISSSGKLEQLVLTYQEPKYMSNGKIEVASCCHKEGLLAFSNPQELADMLVILKSQ